MSEPGHNSDVVVGERLLSFIQRVERLNEELGAINTDKAEVFQEAKSTGFDTKAMKKLIRERAMDSQEREEQDQLLDLYRHAIKTAESRRPSRDPEAAGRSPIPSRPAASDASDDDDPLTVR